MSLLGIHLQLLIGEILPVPAPLEINEALESVEVMESDEKRSGFQLTFQMGRTSFDFLDYALIKHPLLDFFNRVIIKVFIGTTSTAIMDGIILNHQPVSGDGPGSTRLILTGDDVSVALDWEQTDNQFVGQTDRQIVEKIISQQKYGKYGFKLITSFDKSKPDQTQPNTDEGNKNQPKVWTDLEYINHLASQYGYVFFVRPYKKLKIPYENVVHWGDPPKSGDVQGTLYANMGSHSNVDGISFNNDAGAVPKVCFIRDGKEETIDKNSRGATTIAPEAKRKVFISVPVGASEAEAYRMAKIRAQGMVNKAAEQAVTASGELNVLRYGSILHSRELVKLSGVGLSYDGIYYVKTVTHKIDMRKGEYRQSFTLTREGLNKKKYNG